MKGIVNYFRGRSGKGGKFAKNLKLETKNCPPKNSKLIPAFTALAFFLCLLPGAALAATVALPQTGQTTCYNASGTEISCSGTGQDGEKKAGEPWPGTRFTAGTGAEADCITDNLTGLMWPKNGNLAGTKTWWDALTYPGGLSYCGHSDWRLPNRTELMSLVNYGQLNISTWLNGQGFTSVQTDAYWSSTTCASFTTSAWAVVMSTGRVTDGDKTVNNLNVWPVRAGD